MQGFARVSVAVPTTHVANVQKNCQATIDLIHRAHDDDSALCVFPELGLSGYTARDLFFSQHLLDACEDAVVHLAEASKGKRPLVLIGTPLRHRGGVYNVAVAICDGRVLGVVPKSFLPNYREFEERRWFRPGTEVAAGSNISIGGQAFAFGTDLLFCAQNQPDFVVGVEICEDLWVQSPPHARLCSAGATVIANLSASNFTVGKAELRRLLATSASDRGKCAYLYVAAGPGESSTDLAFDADAFVVDNGHIIAESERFCRRAQLVSTDVDLAALQYERRTTNSFGDCAAGRAAVRRLAFTSAKHQTLRRQISPHPFLPADEKTLAARCWEIFEIQTNALYTRMRAIGSPKLVLGVSGGLDSTHAALVAAAALDLAGRPRRDLLCVTMPGFGTTSSTKSNAELLSDSLGATFFDLSIEDAAYQVLRTSSHPAALATTDIAGLLDRLREDPARGDAAFENVQARMRTLLLMTMANQHGGIVVGTGDLSEKALGWSTYAGDHIAMYDVNAGVPKTLIQFVIRWVVNERIQTWTTTDCKVLRETLEAILHTPISPELLPPDAEGQIAQLTEARIGPYELHDFYLFHMVRRGAAPTRVLRLAEHAFADRYSRAEHKKWLAVFLRRFFHNQFKRSCATDGPKVGMVSLSPRGDWRMPSDAQVDSWLQELDAL